MYENLVAYLIEHTRPAPDHPADAVIPSVGTDVRAVISVLSRQRVLFDSNLEALSEDNLARFGKSTPPSSAGVHLVGVNLTGAWLSGANFSEATLTDTNFIEATLHTTDFHSAMLTNAHFPGASLSMTIFVAAKVTSCNFMEADLYMAFFGQAILVSADFERARLSVVDFSEAVLTEDTFFHGATIKQDVTFVKAQATAAIIRHLEDFDIDPLPALIA